MRDLAEKDMLIAADEVPSKGTTRRLTASTEHCAALSDRFGYRAISELSAEFDLKPLAGGPMIRVRGTLNAEIEQVCVVTGEPVPEVVDAEFEIIYAPPGMVEENLDLTLADADPPEPIGPEGIDLAELAAQQLALSAEEYPRADGSEFSSVLDDIPEDRKKGLSNPEMDGPFAALSGLRTAKKTD